MLSFEDVLKEFEDFFANGILFRSSPLPLGIYKRKHDVP